VEAEFHPPGEAEPVLGRATWDGSGVRFEAEAERTRQKLTRVFRPTPVIVDDPSLRSYGTSGPVQLPPGTLAWFRAAAITRGKEEGFGVRLVPNTRAPLGWDPAGTYRPLTNQVERRELE
jgi:hypothetical protein